VDVNKIRHPHPGVLQFIVPGAAEKFEEIQLEESTEAKEQRKEPKKSQRNRRTEKRRTKRGLCEDPETLVLTTIKELEGEDGAPGTALSNPAKGKALMRTQLGSTQFPDG